MTPPGQGSTPQALDSSSQNDGSQTLDADVQATPQQATAPQTAASRVASGGSDAASQTAPSSTPAAGQPQTFDAAFAIPLQTPLAASVPSASAPAAAATPVAHATLVDLASQTAAQVGGGASQFQITLTPEGLGQVSVTVNVAAEGKVSAAFAFEKPETADALSGRASDLQKALEQAGFSLSDSGLSFAVATPTGHGQGAGADQNPGGGPGQGANQGGAGQGSGQGSNPGSNTAFAQTSNLGSGQGEGGAQGRSWTYNQAAGRAFATASDAAASVDQSPQSPYASRSASGLDIRI